MHFQLCERRKFSVTENQSRSNVSVHWLEEFKSDAKTYCCVCNIVYNIIKTHFFTLEWHWQWWSQLSRHGHEKNKTFLGCHRNMKWFGWHYQWCSLIGQNLEASSPHNDRYGTRSSRIYACCQQFILQIVLPPHVIGVVFCCTIYM